MIKTNLVALIFNSTWFYRAIHILGLAFLAGYLCLAKNWHFSIGWGLAYFVITLAVSYFSARFGVARRFQKLNKYLTHPSEVTSVSPQSKDETALAKARYLRSFFTNGAVLFVPTEDALVCVPVLLAGISPLSALLAGVVFGVIHLGGYSYIECIAKGISYALIAWIILPHGLLTVIFGHLITDAIGLAVLRIAIHQLSGSAKITSQRE